jgi:hypothetical protein
MPVDNGSRAGRPGTAKPTAMSQRSPIDAAEALAATHRLLAEQARTISIGRRYLELYPREAEPSLLSRKLLLGLQGSDPQTVRTVVRQRIRRDLRSGEVVRIDGFVLARSECRACALVALAAAPLG